MTRAILLFLLLLGVSSADQIRIDHREGTTGNYAPIPLTTTPNYVLTFDANGNPVIGPMSGGPTGPGVTDGDKGDITVSGTGATWMVDPGSITLAKMANLGPGMLLGRSTGTGPPQAITIGTGLTLTGTVLSAAGGPAAPGDSVSLDALPDGQEIRGASVASIVIGTGKGTGETTILAPWDVDGAVDGAPRITMTSGNDPTLGITFTGGPYTAPGLRFAEEVTTGIYRPGNYHIGILAGGALPAAFGPAQLILETTTGLQWASTYPVLSPPDTYIYKLGPRNVRIGANPSAAPVANTLTIGEASLTGGANNNLAGGNGTIQSGLGTGTGTVSSLIFQTPTTVASGSTVQTYATRLTLNSSGMQIPTSTPASATAPGVAGTITWDDSYIYICTATNTWKRTAIATWP